MKSLISLSFKFSHKDGKQRLRLKAAKQLGQTFHKIELFKQWISSLWGSRTKSIEEIRVIEQLLKKLNPRLVGYAIPYIFSNKIGKPEIKIPLLGWFVGCVSVFVCLYCGLIGFVFIFAFPPSLIALVCGAALITVCVIFLVPAIEVIAALILRKALAG